MSKSETITQKIAALEKLAKFFENEKIDIDEGIKKYEQGMQLAQQIKKQLKSYDLKINEIKAKYNADVEEADSDNYDTDDQGGLQGF